ncbi:MAG: cell envelope integrity protein CreD [Bacteroidales bacterium]|jgi:inner membrane protein|nr:cell envelope integrity protein CreD [Bacteroidales bacterium]
MKNGNQNEIKWYETLTFKMALLGIMAIMFLLPLELIRNVIRERAANSLSVQEEISEEWGKEQTVSGPVLNIPVRRTNYSAEGKASLFETTWHIMPEELEITGILSPQIRYKGIYESIIYETDLSLSGTFEIAAEKSDPDLDIMWEDAYYTLGVSDNRGIMKDPVMKISGSPVSARPGVSDHDLFDSGLTYPVAINEGQGSLVFDLQLSLRGSSGLFFAPAGKSTCVSIESSWDAPSFTGNYLPGERTVGEEGFEAIWHITHLNRNFPQSWYGSVHNPEKESFGVKLILEVDHYRKAERSAKYGLLFIAFTFLVLLFLEISSNKRLHLFHYFLVSLALVLFFSLLNALSEHIGFNPAYIISAFSTIALLTFFTASLLKKSRYVLMVSGMLTVLYVFIYVLLALNEFAYLAGNIGLFIGLAAIMYLSAKTNLFGKSNI